MDIVVVYESQFGNTRSIADALADGVQHADPRARVSVVPVSLATPEKLEGVRFVLVGGPTHALGMSRRWTRRLRKGSPGTDLGVREWLDTLPPAQAGAAAAAFDTRLPNRLAGSAARGIARKLRRAGYELVAEPQSFLVTDAEGPLRPGESDRARAWGESLVGLLVRRPVH